MADNLAPTDLEFTCRGCGLLCDDLQLAESGGKHWDATQACQLGKDWLSSLTCDVQPLPNDTALDQARETVNAAKSPWIVGLNGLTIESERAAVELAERLQAGISLGTDLSKITTAQRYGGASCSLGEVRHRADLLLCGNVDIFRCWPRFGERFIEPNARFLAPDQQRQLIFLGDCSQVRQPNRYNQLISVPASELPSALIVLRRMIANNKPLQNGWQTELPASAVEQLETLAAALLEAEYPVLLSDSIAVNQLQWTKLTVEVNNTARLHRLSVSPGQAAGEPSETLLAMTGFPDAIRFRDHQIEHDLDAFSADRILSSPLADLIIYVGASLTPAWQARLLAAPASISVVVMVENLPQQNQLPEHAVLLKLPHVSAGTLRRADGIPVPVRPLPTATASQPTLSSILGDLAPPA